MSAIPENTEVEIPPLVTQAEEDRRLKRALEALDRGEKGIPLDVAFARLRAKHLGKRS